MVMMLFSFVTGYVNVTCWRSGLLPAPIY
uniref:Uncharacterized protein n=1 Tax=Rhizophora mucronata TaxID=61149 RepID=A0A2P2J1N5_RHIMU